MPGPFGHLVHALGVGETIWFCLLVAGYLAVVGPRFRGLLLPVLPRRPGGGVRRSLRISSYLPRGFCAAYLVAAWAAGLAAGYGIVIGAGDYHRAFSGTTLIDHVTGVVLVAGGIVVFVLGVWYVVQAYYSYLSVRRWEQARVQRRRDLRATRTLAAIQNDAPAPYGAYSIWLRPFTSTGRCWAIARSTKAGTKNQPAMVTGYRVVVADLETLLATVMEPMAPVIALGQSGEQVGAGRVDVPDDRWQEAFAVLARSAHAIFLLPSTREGTHWEIDFLMREPALLERTVFLVPPAFFGHVMGGIVGVERDPGARALGNRRKLYRSRYADRTAKGAYEAYERLQAVNTEVIRDVLEAEAPEVRAEAFRTLEGILPAQDYAAVIGATGGTLSRGGGALVKLGNDGAVRVTALASLRVGDTGWYRFSSGPRFDELLFRTGLLDMVRSPDRPR
jgi:hypothetical protein